ncbi:probable peroxisomal membrane protein PEX13 [Daphnia magna]|uniref:probable peroxisomal membrane protein PEX13 n=1 Tax=Daphnia magna TaxID=35525 RepID=UPI001E1BAC92|nr:probable peroxisomal membrane protein PEX13 [Daphnia magna]
MNMAKFAISFVLFSLVAVALVSGQYRSYGGSMYGKSGSMYGSYGGSMYGKSGSPYGYGGSPYGNGGYMKAEYNNGGSYHGGYNGGSRAYGNDKDYSSSIYGSGYNNRRG